MSTSDPGAQGYPNEEELRAAYEQEMKRLRVEHVLLENVVTLVNLGMRRTGLMGGTEDERDPEQVRLAVDSVRAVLPLLEPSSSPEQLEQIRQALSQLQMAYVQVTGGAGPGEPGDGPGGPGGGPGGPESGPAGPRGAPPQPGSETPKAGDAGPAQRSGRLWIPGQ
jgi:hypothetical protein